MRVDAARIQPVGDGGALPLVMAEFPIVQDWLFGGLECRWRLLWIAQPPPAIRPPSGSATAV